MDMISPSIAALTPSLTLKVTNRAKAMKAAGEEVYGLAGGEPEMDTPDNIKQAAITALNNGATKYTPSAGLPALRQAIADKLKRENNLEYDPSQITVGAGAKHACFNAIMATVSEGDEVIIPAPYWVSYPEMVRMCGGVPVIVETTPENGWKLTAEQFEEAMTPRTKMVILTTPNNPTGAVYFEEELRALGEVAVSEDILILADEIYEHLVYGDVKHVSIASLSPELYDLPITITGFSKCYAMTGWRLGYACGPAPIIRIMTKIHQSAIMSAPTTSQYAAITALKECDGEIDRMRDEYNMRRRLVVKSFNDMGLTCFEPRGAFYAFPCIKSTGMSSQDFCTKLLEQKHVAIIPGDAFGASGEGYARISYAYSVEHLKEALKRIREFLQENGIYHGI